MRTKGKINKERKRTNKKKKKEKKLICYTLRNPI